MNLPRILHFVWIGPAFPAWARANVEQFRRLNPGYEIRIHGDEVLLPELDDAYERAASFAAKSDLLRLSALRRFGGWYFDVDFWPLRPLDDAVRAWGLGGRRLFVSRQQGHISGDALPFCNTPMAAMPDSTGLALMIRTAPTIMNEEGTRTAYGPELLKACIAIDPTAFQIASPGWFFPLSIDQACEAYPMLREDHLRVSLDNGSAGQVPFAAHLWAGANDLAAAYAATTDARPLAVIQAANGDDHALHHIAIGLTHCGYRVVESADPETVLRSVILPSLVVIWNGRNHLAWTANAERVGARPLFLEHGFFDRGAYTQADHRGFLHWASWRSALAGDAPADGADRLARFYPRGLVPMYARPNGYVLVIGQVSGDTQLADSEITGPAPLVRMVSRALPDGVHACFRPHPHEREAPIAAHNVPLMYSDADERAAYAETKHGSGMERALAGAMFVVAINSNALNEALAAGVPCLAFGPFLGIDSGVVRRATLATMADDLLAMLHGWCPEQDAVDNYLRWLACRQWSSAEFEDPDTLAPLLRAAGAPVLDEVAHV